MNKSTMSSQEEPVIVRCYVGGMWDHAVLVRKTPDRLQSVLCDSEWKEFCRTIDGVNEKSKRECGKACVTIFAATFGVGFIFVGALNKYGPGLLIGSVLLVMTIVIACCHYCNEENTSFDMNEEVDKACEGYCRRYPQVIVSYRRVDRVFEIFVVGSTPAVAVAEPCVGSTTADRIKDLDLLKGRISEEQHAAKLQEILDAV